MPADQNLIIRGFAADFAHDVVGHARADFHLVIHDQRAADRAVFQLFPDFLRIGHADGTGRDGRRAADILAVQRVVRHLREAADVRRQNRRRALVLRLQHRIGDPPVVALVDIHEHNFARHVQPFVIPHRALADVDDFRRQAVRRRGRRGVGIHRIILAVHRETRAVELPSVAVRRHLFHIFKTEREHFLIEVFRRGVLRVAARLTAA